MENIGKDRWLICIALLGHFIRMKSTSKYYFCILKLAGSGFKSIQRKILKFKKNPSPAQILILAQGAKFLIVIYKPRNGRTSNLHEIIIQNVTFEGSGQLKNEELLLVRINIYV